MFIYDYYYYYYTIIIIIINSLEFFTSALADGVSLELSVSKSPQVSRTLLSILAVSNNAVDWMVSTHPPISKSSSLFNNPLVTVPKAPITFGTIVTFMFHIFFQFSSKVEVLILLFTFFQFYSVVSRDSKADNFANFFLLIIIIIIVVVVVVVIIIIIIVVVVIVVVVGN